VQLVVVGAVTRLIKVFPEYGETIRSRIILQATDFQPCQLGRAVERDLAKLTHYAMEPAGEVLDGSTDVAPLGEKRGSPNGTSAPVRR
jgi:hypothetical protein